MSSQASMIPSAASIAGPKRAPRVPICRHALVATVAYGAGAVVIALALTVGFTEQTLEGLFDWLRRVFSVSFMLCFAGLVAVGINAFWHLRQRRQSVLSYEAGMQAANGLATLALTFTLLGISLGIGSLSEQALTPETVPEVIQALTQHFATAFMTTVVGLPTASALRAALSLEYVRQRDLEATSHQPTISHEE